MYDVIKKTLLLCFAMTAIVCYGQTVSSKLTAAWQRFENDSQLRNAISSLYVVDAKSGNVIFEKNATIGLAPASTQKIITSASAYELLGKDFRYQTSFGYVGAIEGRILKGNFFIKPSGDPTLGSWRWKSTSDTAFMSQLTRSIKKLNITGYNGIKIAGGYWNDETIPDGWIWQDIGNYYGAGAAGFNWRENQFDIILQSGKTIGDPVRIVEIKPAYQTTSFTSLATSAAKGSGDNAYVYYPLSKPAALVRGTIPVNENAFEISAAIPDPAAYFENWFSTSLQLQSKLTPIQYETRSTDSTLVYMHVSPPLDSIIYWFNKKSINLYGEALVKTIAAQKEGQGATDKGADLVKNLWKAKGIPPTELNIVDGSGLSPLNRVTTHAQVRILQYALKQPWFKGFYYSLPEYNGMKLKSGTIRGVKGFCGYHTSGDGNEYIISFLVNNYNGSASALVKKMYAVLDVLK